MAQHVVSKAYNSFRQLAQDATPSNITGSFASVEKKPDEPKSIVKSGGSHDLAQA